MAEENRENESEVKRNYEAFMQQLPQLLITHPGKFALMRDAKVVDFFDTSADAYRAGQRLFQDQRFSIQQVIDSPVDLGYFSHALPQRTI
jgi:hypothetical protein